MAKIPDNQARVTWNGVDVNPAQKPIEAGTAIDEDTIEFNLKLEIDPQTFDMDALPGAIYYSTEPQEILMALPGWFRRLVVGYGRFVIKRRRGE